MYRARERCIGGRLLLIEHYVAPSQIHGLGVFSRNTVSKGALVWIPHPVIDREFAKHDLRDLPRHVVKLIEQHSEYLPDRNIFRLSADGCYFMNHSDQPNLRDEGDRMFANRDIQSGEEITCDYRITKVMSFDPDHLPAIEAKDRAIG